ncbi:hypothetical protein ACFLS8_00190 [Chloroflexota bacterium]
MNKESIVKVLKLKRFKKLTGPPEHWLTTFNTKFWGLETKYGNEWNSINVGDLFLLHSTGIEYLTQKPKLVTGIIGIGIVGSIIKKVLLNGSVRLRITRIGGRF